MTHRRPDRNLPPSRIAAAACAALWAALCAAIASAAPPLSVSLESFGVDGAFRPGDWTGVRLRVGGATLPQAVRLEIEVPDADGDIAVATRSTVLTPGQQTSRWLYLRTPPVASTSAIAERLFTVRIFEEIDGARGAELAVARISPASGAAAPLPVGLEEGLMGVIAPRAAGGLGLEAYDTLPPGLSTIPALNDRVRIATGLDPRDLPDRWEGWWSFSALVWAGDAPSHRPEQLGFDEGRALLEWVERGGTLVVVLPESGDPWLSTGTVRRRHFLSDLLPDSGVERHTGVEVATVLPALSKSPRWRDERATISIRTFDPTALPPAWTPLLLLPKSSPNGTTAAPLSGATIAIERRLGVGRLVLFGIDLERLRRMGLQEGGLPQADSVWNRLLGRRGDTLTAGEYARLDGSEPRRLVRRLGEENDLGGGRLVADRIGLSGQAALGVLSAMVLFGAYWLVAGPIGFAVLRSLRRERLAWIVFLLVAAGFTLVAWWGSGFLRQSRTRVIHVSVLDAIATEGPDASVGAPAMLRIESWFSAALPGYGRTRLALAGDGTRRDLLSSWSPPPGEDRGRFPDTARYDLPIDSPQALAIPSRATAATFHLAWLGAPSSEWQGWPRSLPGHPVELVTDPEAADPTLLLRGRLRHDLPQALADVRVIHVTPYATPLPRFAPGPLPIVEEPGEMPLHGRFVILPEWPAGETLDLERVLYPRGPAPARERGPESLSFQVRARYYDPLAGRGGTLAPRQVALAREDPIRAFDMLGLYSMLPPPPYLQNPPPVVDPLRIRRMLGHRMDLGAWFTRPCLIVIGYLPGSALPAPLSIDGAVPPSEGLTMVRWVLPLPALPAAAAPPAR